MSFQNFSLHHIVIKNITSLGYSQPTPIQEAALPTILSGADLIAAAQTGTGKTLAYLLPIVSNLLTKAEYEEAPTVLVLVPTRELVLQVFQSIQPLLSNTPFKALTIYGGVSMVNQITALQKGCTIIIATPGRLLDLWQQKKVTLKKIKHLVLDEADLMLDLGFAKDISKIISATPTTRQTLLFSATIPKEIKKLAANILVTPQTIDVVTTANNKAIIEQSVYHVSHANKPNLLVHLIQQEKKEQLIIFTRTKRGADKLVKVLMRQGIHSCAIHGDKSQAYRTKTLDAFKKNKLNLLIATDVAARGIDIQQLPLVINYDMPQHPPTYVHRIGRTGRAGLSGKAITFCDQNESDALKDIQKLLGKTIPSVAHQYQ